jgi:nucleotide-binding universal stress UspA family protein
VAHVTVVVGVDESDRSITAVESAAGYAAALGTDLHVVFVSHVPATMLAVLAGVPSAADDLVEAQRTAVWDMLDEPLGELPAPVKRVDLEGYPADELVRYAEDVDAELIVVGSRGRGDLASLVLGSTSHRVVNHAPCDVLVVRGKQEGP